MVINLSLPPKNQKSNNFDDDVIIDTTWDCPQINIGMALSLNSMGVLLNRLPWSTTSVFPMRFTCSE